MTATNKTPREFDENLGDEKQNREAFDSWFFEILQAAGICYPPLHCHKLLAKVLKLGKRAPSENDVRERIWDAFMADFGSMIDRDFGGLT